MGTSPALADSTITPATSSSSLTHAHSDTGKRTSPENSANVFGDDNDLDIAADTAPVNSVEPRQSGLQPDTPEDLTESPANTAVTDTETATGTTSEQDTSPDISRTELVFVDASVGNAEQLLSGLKSQQPDTTDWIVIDLDADVDGVTEITDTLEGSVDIDAIHIISHGDGQGFQLGNGRLDSNTIAQYTSDLTRWSESLTEDADLLIYGCDLAGTEAGRNLVDAIADATNSDVAASIDRTGHSQLGADWNLEYTIGEVSTDIAISAAAQSGWIDTLAAITVTTTDDENNGDTSTISALQANSGGNGISLREAIIAANNTAGDDTIILSPGTYSLNIAGSDTATAATGDLDITSAITITGAGGAASIIEASTLGDRIFEVSAAGNLTLDSLALADANSTWRGGAIDNAGVVNATDTVIRNNTGGVNGGAINNAGTVTLERVSLYDNTSTSMGGAIYQTTGTLSLTNVVVSGNSSSTHGGGALLAGGTASISYSTFADNTTNFNTGGFSGTATISNSIFANNTGTPAVDASGNITSNGYNIIENYSGFTTAGTDITGPYNMGARFIDPTTGHAYYTTAPGDAAFDAGGGGSPSTDILGTNRGADPDIGAYEYPDYIEPTQAVPGPQNVNEDSTLTFSSSVNNAITVSAAADPGNIPLQVSMSVNDGVLNLSDLTGITIVEGTQNSDSISFNGTKSDINAALDGMTFTPDANFNGSVTLNITTALAADLAGHYTFDGGNAIDQSAGTSEDGTLSGNATTTIDGTRGEVLSLDGDNDYVTINSDFGQPANYTLSAWVNLTAADTGGADVITLGTESALRLDTPVGPTGFFWDGSAWQYTQASIDNNVAGTGWRHVSYTVDSTNNVQSLYIDGVLAAQTSYTADSVTQGTNARIGAHGDDSTRVFDFNGLIDDARIYTRALHAAEITALASNQIEVSNSVSISVDSVNDAPTIANLDGNGLIYNSGDGAQLLDQGTAVLVTDIDNTNFDSGSVTASITGGNPTEDVIAIRNQGTGAGQIGFDGTNVRYAGTIIGTASGGTGGADLVVTLNALSNQTSVAALIANITFENTNITSPTTGTRLISFEFNDGNGGVSAPSSANLQLVTPTVSLIQDRFDSATYNNNDGTINWSNSWSEFGESNGSGSGVVSVLNNALAIGGSGAFGLDITGMGAMRTADLSSAVSASLSMDLWREGTGNGSLLVQIQTDGGWSTLNSYPFSSLPTLRNTYSFDISPYISAATSIRLIANGDVGSLLSSGYYYGDNISISYIPNTPPLLALGSTGIAFTENQSATPVASAGSVLDADSTDLNGGVLTIELASGGTNNDQLAIQNQGTAAGEVGLNGNNVTYGGIIVGTLSGGTAGTPLSVLFNANATTLTAQAILRATTFDNVSEAPSTADRILRAVVTDGDGGTSTAATKTISLTSVNDAPLLDNTGDLTLPAITEDETSNSGQSVAQILASGSGAPISDIDAGSVDGIAIIDSTNGNGSWQFSTNGGGNWQGIGTVTESSALLLRTTDLIRYTPNGQNGNTTDPAFEFRAWDQTSGISGSKVNTTTNGGTSAFSSAVETASISVTDINDAPLLDNTGTVVLITAPPQTEDAGAPSGAVGTAITSLVQTGGNITDVDISSQTGIAITAADITNGTWWYTTDGGTNWNALGTVSESSAHLLSANSNTRIYFHSQPDFNGTISDALTFRAWDRTTGSNGSVLDVSTNGGTSAYSTDIESASVTISASNDAPQLVGPSIVNNGNFNNGDLNGWIATGNIDNSGTQVRFGQAGGANGDLVQVLTTTAGNTYVLSFDYYDSSATNSQSLAIYTAGFNVLLDTSIESGITENTPRTYHYRFIADSVSTVLTFADTSNDHVGVQGYLDNISVTTDALPNTLSYTENDTLIINPAVVIADIDDTNIETAVVQITGNYNNAEDVLGYIDQNGISGTWNPGTGTLSLTGTATTADYETALRSISYYNSSENPDTATRTINVTVNDGDDDSTPLSHDVTVIAVNDAPVQTAIEPATLPYSESDPPALVTSTLAISDADDTMVESAFVSIDTNFTIGEDVLSFTAQPGISGSYNASTGVLSLTGTSSLANYQAALRSVTYENTSSNPSALTRTIAFTINDGDSDSNTVSRDIAVTTSNDAPQLASIETGALSYTENDTPLAISSTLALSDADDANIEAATVSIGSNFVAGQDTLAFTNQSGITGNYNATTGVLSLSGSASVADYQSALRSVTYENTSDNPDTLNRTISLVVNDGDTDSNIVTRTLAITAVNDAPAVAGIEATVLAYTENDPALPVSASISLSDSDDTVLESASIAISNNFAAGEDQLVFTNQSGITSSYNSTTGVLSLSGSASVADYQSALRTVTYENTSDNPVTLNRTISLVVNDGDTDSNTATRDIAITTVNDAPAVTAIEASVLAYTENEPALPVSTSISLSDSDYTVLESASIAISNNFAAGEDQLLFTNQSGITGSYNATTGVLSLSGSASVADYQSALRSVTYENTSDDPSVLPRDVTFTVNDGDLDSNPQTRTLSVAAVNDAPVISGMETTPQQYTENNAPAVITSNISLSDLDDTVLHGATVAILFNYTAAEDVLLFTDQAGISGTFDSATGVLSLSGVASVANYEAALRSVSYQNTSDNPSDLTRTITFSVSDANTSSNTAIRDITLTAVNDAPVTSLIETGSVAVTENDSATAVTQTLSLADLDNATLSSAQVVISANYQSAEDLLSYSGPSAITAAFDAATGTLTLTGSASVAQYQAALRAVTYTNLSDNPDTALRTVSISVSDGLAQSNISTRPVTITAVNDAPQQSAIESVPLVFTENDTARVITDTLTLNDADNLLINSAQISIATNYNAAEDTLNFTAQSGISGNFDNNTGILSLSGAATVADYQQAIRSVTYSNSSDHPDPLSRQITFTVNDADLDSNVLSRDIEIVRVNDAPVVSALESTALPYSENTGPLAVSNTLALSEPDDTQLESATIQINGNYQPAEDRLDYTGSGNIAANWNAATGTLTLSGTDTVAAYQAALRSVSYENDSDNPDDASRTLSFSVNDGDTDSNTAYRDIAITVSNDAPLLSNMESADIVYLENSGPITLSNTLSLSDLDNQLIQSATISISSGYAGIQDVLSFTDTATISASWDAATAELTLTGSDTIAAYQAALRSVTYMNTSDNPDTTPRTISLSINDNTDTSNVLSRQITVVALNDAPVGSNIEDTALNYPENAGNIPVTTSLSISDVDDTLLESAVIRIADGYQPSEDLLRFTDTPTIAGSWDNATGIMTLTGTDTVANYQAALRAVQYENTSNNPQADNRTIDFRTFDGELFSNSQTRIITINAVNDAPAGTDATLTFLEDNIYTLAVADFGFSDALDNHSFDAIIISQLPINGTLSLAGVPVTAGQIISVSQIAANQLQFSTPPDVNANAYDQFGFLVQDDGGTDNGGINTDPQQNIITFNITNVNDAPSGGDNKVTTPEDTDYIFSREGFLFTDPLDNNTFASVLITTLPDSGILQNNGIALNAGDSVSTDDIDNGLLIYRPPLNATGSDYNGFGFQVQDNGGAANGGVFTDPTENYLSFDVPGINDAPLLMTEQATVDEGSRNILTSAVISASDADDLLPTELTFSVDSIPLHGTLTLNGSALTPLDTFTLAHIQDNQLVYTHDGSETSTDFFDVTVRDGGEDGAQPSSGRFTFLINEVIDPAPVVDTDALNLKFGESFDSLDGDLLASGSSTLAAAQLSANSALLIEIETQPQHGSVELNEDGTFSYVHDGSTTLADFFTYRVTNEDGVYTIARIDISVEPPMSAAFAPPPTPAEPVSSSTEEPDAEEEETEPESNTAFSEAENFALLPKPALEREENAGVIDLIGFVPAAPRIELSSLLDNLNVRKHNNVKTSTVVDGSVPLSAASFEVLLDLNAPRTYDVASNKNFLDGLSRLENDLQQSDESSGKRYRLANDTTLAVSLSATAGVIAWVLRGSALFASALASTPLWSSIDPVKVLTGPKEKNDSPAADQEVEDIFSEQR